MVHVLVEETFKFKASEKLFASSILQDLLPDEFFFAQSRQGLVLRSVKVFDTFGPVAVLIWVDSIVVHRLILSPVVEMTSVLILFVDQASLGLFIERCGSATRHADWATAYFFSL